jgi:hypothetical protein
MYFQFKKYIIYALLILSLAVSTPCIAIAALQRNKPEYLAYFEGIKAESYITKVSLGTITRIMKLDTSNHYLGDVFIYLNVVGIVFFLLCSIYQRKSLLKL